VASLAAAGQRWRAPAPSITLGRFHPPVWRLTAIVGNLSGILLVGALAAARSGTPLPAAGIAVGAATAGALGALALVLVHDLWNHRGGYTFYHHQLAALAVSAAFLALLGQPLLPTLDLVAVGSAAAVATGRVGCLAAGCCHGRPHGWGICYGQAHVAAGFPRYLAGVRLVPVQAIESLWVAAIVVVGSILALRNPPPGSVLAWYVVAYGLGRFAFEFLRGDAARPYWHGVSEAQWTSLLAVACVTGAEWAGWLPFRAWHAAALVVMLSAVAYLALIRRPSPALLSARHIAEVARALAAAEAAAAGPPGKVQVAHTSLGIQLSASLPPASSSQVLHVALSARDGSLTGAAARALSRLIVQLEPASADWQLLGGERGVFHLLLTRTPGGAEGSS
jgi:hypothetical protein